MNRLTYTKIFLNAAKMSTDEANIERCSFLWWANTRNKDKGGLRLTLEGRDFLKNDLNITFYRIHYSHPSVYNTKVLIHLDNYITCPYYMTTKYIELTDDRIAMEVSLFNGDLDRYGAVKAIEKQKKL